MKKVIFLVMLVGCVGQLISMDQSRSSIMHNKRVHELYDEVLANTSGTRELSVNLAVARNNFQNRFKNASKVEALDLINGLQAVIDTVVDPKMNANTRLSPYAKQKLSKALMSLHELKNLV